MPKRHYFTRHQSAALTGTTVDYLYGRKCEEGEELHYVVIGCSDLTTATKSVNIGIDTGTKNIWLGGMVLTTNGLFYEFSREVVCRAGERLVAGFRGLTANDVCVLNVNGYSVKLA